jgi:hypothetical protein
MVKECKQTKRAMIGVLEHSLKKAEIYSHSAEVLMKGTTVRKILITALNSPKITKALSKLKNKSVVRKIQTRWKRPQQTRPVLRRLLRILS